MKVFSNLGRWQNYIHILLLTFAVFYTHYLSDIWGIEKLVVDNVWYGYPYLFVFYAGGLLVADTIIHLIFSILPEPYKWED